jgi:hypothetical protein
MQFDGLTPSVEMSEAGPQEGEVMSAGEENEGDDSGAGPQQQNLSSGDVEEEVIRAMRQVRRFRCLLPKA